MSPRLLVFAGSVRRDSFNARLARFAAREVEAAGAQATLLDIADFGLPLYNGDLEADEGLPAGAVRPQLSPNLAPAPWPVSAAASIRVTAALAIRWLSFCFVTQTVTIVAWYSYGNWSGTSGTCPISRATT